MELVVPGQGTASVRLGATPDQIRASLGAPPKVVEHLPLSYLFIYPDLGIEVDFVVPGGPADTLFFFGEWAGHRAAAVATAGGLTFGARRDQIVAAWGEPAGSDLPHAYERRFHTGWLYYRQGIQFHLDDRDRLVIVAVMRPQKGTA